MPNKALVKKNRVVESSKVSNVEARRNVKTSGGSIETINSVLNKYEGQTGISNIRAIIRTGNINARGSGGYTALMLASRSGYLEVAEAIIAAGADVNARSGSITAMSWAISFGHSDIVALLKGAGAN